MLCASHGFAQKTKRRAQQLATREQLESQRVTILEEIKRTQEQLVQLKKDKSASIEQLQTLQSKLEARQSLIRNINREIDLINDNINLASKDVVVLKTQLDTLKKQYAEMVRYTYKNRTASDMIVFLFSASSFNDAVRRLNYAKQYRNFRADQATKIVSASKQLSNKITILNLERQKKDQILSAQQMQTKVLESETLEKDKLVTQLKGKEQELTKGLATKKKAAEDLNRAIANAIQREIEIARKRAMEEQRKKLAEERAKKERELKLAQDKKRQELALAEKRQREEAARKLAEAKRLQEEKEQQALAEKRKREERERQLAQEKKDREAREQALAKERRDREEAERKAAMLAESERKERERQLALQKQRQEERARQLKAEKDKQEERAKQLLAEKQRQEEDQRRLADQKRKQEREQTRLASEKTNYNPRYIPTLADKEKPVAVESKTSDLAYAEPKSTKSSSDDYKYALTPAERELTNNFEMNKGRLPWPVEKGYVVEHFGKNKHPLFNITTENYGIDIKTNSGATARAIYAGEVNSVFPIAGMGQTVLVNHGSFYTVYSRLGKVNVSKGSKISMKQPIGTVLTDDEGKTQIHFEIWKVGANGQPFKVNPEQWIAN